MTKAKYHHLVPQTYLKSWTQNGKSIKVIDKKSGKFETQNIERNFGEIQFHSIVAGMPICEESDLNEIYKILNGCDVFYKEERLNTLFDVNYHYSFKDEWKILKNGFEVSKKEKNIIMSDIEKTKIRDIEELWSKKYEDKWPMLLDIIQQKIELRRSPIIDEFYKGLIMKMVVALNWRGFQGNDIYKDAFCNVNNITNLKEIQIPKKSRFKSYLENVSDEYEHQILLEKYREFLRNDGIIYHNAKIYIQRLTIKFYIAGGKRDFYTSDNPSFVDKNLDGQRVHYFPVTPRILIVIGNYEKKSNKYYIETINDKNVNDINRIIKENSVRYTVVSSVD